MIINNLKDLACKLQGDLGLDPTQKDALYCYGTMAKYMSYACNFTAEVMYEVIPDYGVSEVTRKAIIEDELDRTHDTIWPQELLKAQAELHIEAVSSQPKFETVSKSNASEIVYNAAALSLPPLPYLLQLLTDYEDEVEFKAPLIMAMLPVLGALATDIRFVYDEGEPLHSFSFMTCIEGETASGKSFVKRYVELLTKPYLEEEDRLAPLSTSKTALLHLLNEVGGKHVLAFYPELATLLDQRKRGAWANLDNFLCMAFDNDNFSQKYMSKDSWSGTVKVYYNLLATGTPDVCAEFFHSKTVEEGLQNRVAFVQMPVRFGQKRPSRKTITAEEEYQIGFIAMWLKEQSGTIECPAIKTAIDQWDEEKRKLALATGSKAIDTFRKRSAVIGFRAGMLCSVLEKEHPLLREDEVAKFSTWVAEYVFCNQMDLFGEQMDDVSKTPQTINGHKVPYMLPMLPQKFTREQVSELQAKMGNKNHDPKQNISHWLKIGCIRKVDVNLYEKVN